MPLTTQLAHSTVSGLVIFVTTEWLILTIMPKCANKVHVASLKKYSTYRKYLQINTPKSDYK